VSCELSRTILHGYFDGELDAARAAEFERHLENCAECVAALEAEESVRSAIGRGKMYATAPAGLRKRVLDEVRGGNAAVARVAEMPQRGYQARKPYWGWLAAAAAILLVAYVGYRELAGLQSNSDEAVTAAQVVDAHLRSLQPGHLTDVVSTDQHTVKPWFDGKVDFAPPVKDFAEQGFPLQGGRLDVIRGRTVAALVYGRRKHFISVFVWPAQGKDGGRHSGALQGYQWLDWRSGGMEFWAASDTAATDLEQLRQLFGQ
jgi:mycothiol system anti-sigma-R factor